MATFCLHLDSAAASPAFVRLTSLLLLLLRDLPRFPVHLQKYGGCRYGHSVNLPRYAGVYSTQKFYPPPPPPPSTKETEHATSREAGITEEEVAVGFGRRGEGENPDAGARPQDHACPLQQNP